MIAQFALRLICGMSLMWALMPRGQVTSGFFRIQMLVVMGLGVLAAMAAGIAGSRIGSLIAVGSFVGSALWTLERRTAGEWIGFGVLVLSSWEITFPDLRSPNSMSWNLLSASSQVTSAAVLGGTMVGMLLGHWYLTAPTMSIAPLKRLNLFLGVAGVLRLLVSTTVVLLLWAGTFDSDDAVTRMMAVPKAWLGLRWLAGILGPIVVSLMVWRILKYRNTQAATGVLFVGVILTFIGEMTAALLWQEAKLPL